MLAEDGYGGIHPAPEKQADEPSTRVTQESNGSPAGDEPPEWSNRAQPGDLGQTQARWWDSPLTPAPPRRAPDGRKGFWAYWSAWRDEDGDDTASPRHESVWVDQGALTDEEAEQDRDDGPAPPSDIGSLSDGAGAAAEAQMMDGSKRQQQHQRVRGALPE